MASEELGRAPPPRMENGASSHRMVFQDGAMHFPRAGGDLSTNKPRAPGVFLDDRDGGRFARAQGVELPRGLYGSPGHHHPQSQNWNTDVDTGSDSDEGDGDEDDDLDEVDGLVGADVKNSNNSSGSVQSSSDKIHGERAGLQDRHSFGSSRGIMAKDGNDIRGSSSEQQQQQQERMSNYENAITVVEPEPYFPHVLHGGDGLPIAQKEVGGENGYGFGGRKETASSSGDPRESLRMHLTDPITGALMDDAMILPCGHSFGSSGMQHIYRMKACYKCSQPISEDSVRPNLSLRSAVQAFRREEESQSARASKRRRDRFEQDKCSFEDQFPMDSRGKGVQFPFVVSDRVIIKGNKRTPQRFVGRVAVVTTQCLNGWYVVKTLDNAESVKLQYRSLAKVTDDSSSNMITNKSLSPTWL